MRYNYVVAAVPRPPASTCVAGAGTAAPESPANRRVPWYRRGTQTCTLFSDLHLDGSGSSAPGHTGQQACTSVYTCSCVYGTMHVYGAPAPPPSTLHQQPSPLPAAVCGVALLQLCALQQLLPCGCHKSQRTPHPITITHPDSSTAGAQLTARRRALSVCLARLPPSDRVWHQRNHSLVFQGRAATTTSVVYPASQSDNPPHHNVDAGGCGLGRRCSVAGGAVQLCDRRHERICHHHAAVGVLRPPARRPQRPAQGHNAAGHRQAVQGAGAAAPGRAPVLRRRWRRGDAGVMRVSGTAPGTYIPRGQGSRLEKAKVWKEQSNRHRL